MKPCAFLTNLTFSVGAQAPAFRHGESAVSPLCAILCVHGSVIAASSDAAPRAVGPGRPVRRQRGPLGRASPEHPPPSGVGSVKLPTLIRWLGVGGDDSTGREEQLARLETARAAIARITELEGAEWVTTESIAYMRSLHEHRGHRYDSDGDQEEAERDRLVD